VAQVCTTRVAAPSAGGSGALASKLEAPAPCGGGVCTSPFAATTSPPRATMAARAASSVARRARGRPICTSSGRDTSIASASSAASDVGSPPRSASVTIAPGARAATAFTKASGAK